MNSMRPLSRWALRFSRLPLLKLSTTRMPAPFSMSESTRCEPIKEAPPVTRTFLPVQFMVVSFLVILADSLDFEVGMQRKLRTVHQRPAPALLRFAQQPPEPFQAQIADRLGRFFHLACNKFEGRAHGHDDRNVQQVQMLINPTLLLGQSKTYP